jgi:hypothetical protein
MEIRATFFCHELTERSHGATGRKRDRIREDEEDPTFFRNKTDAGSVCSKHSNLQLFRYKHAVGSEARNLPTYCVP